MICLGERAGGLGKAPGAFRVELHTGPVGQRRLQRTEVGRRRLIGNPFDRPLSQPGDQALMTLWQCWQTGARHQRDGYGNQGSLWRCRCRWFVVRCHSSFPMSHACHPGPKPRYPFGPDGKERGDHTLTRSLNDRPVRDPSPSARTGLATPVRAIHHDPNGRQCHKTSQKAYD